MGTRPEIIKLWPVVEAARRNMRVKVLFTGQHFSSAMGLNVFDELQYPLEDVVMLEMSTFFGESAQHMNGADIVFVQGDTTSTVLGALAAVHRKIMLVHVEAGLRSGDFRMREERNRMMVDHASDLLFCPLIEHEDTCIDEDCEGETFVVGNTVVDVIDAWKAKRREGGSCLVTLHRSELVANPWLFQHTLNAISDFIKEIGARTAIYPVHPFTHRMISQHSIQMPNEIVMAMPYLPRKMWEAIANAPFVFTDSGGIQEEACILGARCFTVRPNTERPETIVCGANVLIEPERSEPMLKKMLEAKHAKAWSHPYGTEVGKTIVADSLQALAK